MSGAAMQQAIRGGTRPGWTLAPPPQARGVEHFDDFGLVTTTCACHSIKSRTDVDFHRSSDSIDSGASGLLRNS
jgi:hypothetical protein